MTVPSLPYVLLLALLIPAVVTDIRQHRIPNWLSLSGWLCGLAVGFYTGGWGGFLDAGAGLLLLLSLTLPFFLFGWMGAGDIKLIAAVGAIVGGGHALNVLLGIVLSGLVMSLAVLAWKGELADAFRRYGVILGLSVISKRPTYIAPPIKQQRLILPYAIPIAAGTLITVAMLYT